MEKNKEIRMLSEMRRGDAESRKVIGYALVFNSDSRDLGGFIETILPSAVNEDTISASDVLALMNHDVHRGVLARSKFGEGSLKLTVDERGVRYEFDAPNTALGNELLEGLTRGDITTSSFAFTIPDEDGETWERMGDDMWHRTITKIERLYDVSPVYREAYEATSVEVAKRGLESAKDALDKASTKHFNDLYDEALKDFYK